MRFPTVFISLIGLCYIFGVDGGGSLLRSKSSHFEGNHESTKLSGIAVVKNADNNDGGGVNKKSDISEFENKLGKTSGFRNGKTNDSLESLTHSSSLVVDKTRSTLEEGSRLLGDAGNDFDFPLFERSVTMQGPGCQNVMWTVDREALKITFHVESSPGADWVGFGLSENGGMKGADIAIVRKSGSEFVIEDRVSVEFDLPKKDTLQNVELLHAEIRDQRIVAVIRRDLQTCDLDDLPVEPNKQYLICASGMTSSDGEILYHGPNVADALVNLMLDEELLLQTKLSAGNESIAISPTMTLRGDPETALVPFPIDIQMPNLNLTANVRTSYMCSEVQIPFGLNRIRVESVWEDGLTLDDGPSPPHFHHLVLYDCHDDFFQEKAKHNNEPYECFEMPSCTVVTAAAKGSSFTMPAGNHMRIEAGRYVLQVHYENRLGVPINGDRTGVRIWVQPPLIPSQTNLARILTFDTQLDSIQIPADPERKDYSIQFMIPGDATREHVPTAGLQVLAAFPHMHENGLRARLQLIRDGKNILDAFNTLSYDFDRQAPIFKQWKLLPGDSLLTTCTYRPHPEHDIHGGFTTADEMCQLYLVIVTPPESTNTTFEQDILGVGYAAQEGQPLKKSFFGPLPVGGDRLNLDPQWATYVPTTKEEQFEPIENYRTNICELAVRSSLYLSVYSFAEYNITGMIAMIVTFCFCALLGAEPVWKRISSSQSDERLKRNTIVYIGQLIYGTFALVVSILAAMEVYRPADTFDAVEPTTYMLLRGTMIVQMLLYLLELFYRIEVRLEVVLHHVLVAFAGIFNSLAMSQTFAAQYILELNLLLFLMAVTDHPLNLTLLLKNLGYAGTTWWPNLCKASGVLFVLTKILPFGGSIMVMLRAQTVHAPSMQITNHSFSDWLETEGKLSLRAVNVFLPILFTSLLLVQLYIGYVLWVLGSRYETKNRNNNAVEKELCDSAMEEQDEEVDDLCCDDMGSPRDETQTSRCWNFDDDSSTSEIS